MYIINNHVNFDTVEEVSTYIVENMDDEYYDDMLDEIYGEINICGYNYYASNALARIDPVAYRCGYVDFCDSLYGDIAYDIERMSDGDTLTEYNFEIVYTED